MTARRPARIALAVRSRGRPRLGLAVVLAAEAGGVLALRRLGSASWTRVDWAHLDRWANAAPAADAVVAVLRLVALCGGAWLLLTTVLYLLGCLTGMAAFTNAVRWVTLPDIRALVEAALVVSIASGVMGGSMAAQAANAPPVTVPPVVVQLGSQQASGGGSPGAEPHAYVPIPAGDPRRPPREPAHPTTTSTAPAAPTTTESQGPAAAEPAPRETSPPKSVSSRDPTEATYVVRAGDNLWTIAAHHLAETTSRAVVRLGQHEIARYWLRVIEANRGRLPSGDPNLIHPGEHVVLPNPAT